MSAVRLILILIVLGGLALFTLQNMSPALPLVVLGGTTLALPLAVWLGGAIAAGAITTLCISGLSSLGRPVSRRVSAKRPAANRFGSPFNTAGNSPRPSAGSATRIQDDWSTGGQTQDEWDNWEDDQQAVHSSDYGSAYSSARGSQPEIRDRLDEDWADWEGYEGSQGETRRQASEPMPDRPPLRTDFEVKQEPATRYQAGSIYSYSYNKPEEPQRRQPEDSYDSSSLEDAPPRRPGGVYDADYRVITPPYRPDPEDISADAADEEDWGLDEDRADKTFNRDDSSGYSDRDRRL
ncbi:MAG TPA: hypothetical protein V6C57_09930 [Coleofasciculaceae cyanobacterium]